ncbi:MAG: L,D-transpeptidase [Acidimicrobiales bacterium]|nr:L,D-transpeptidase [Acidimicrobiales bacterium]
MQVARPNFITSESPATSFTTRLTTLLIVTLLLTTVVSCGTTNSGKGFQFSADQLRPSAGPVGTEEQTTPTTSAPATDWRVEIATATKPVVDVHATKPGSGTPPTTVPAVGSVQPIPRADLLSAGSRVTSTGWQFDNPTYFGNPLVFLVTQNDGDYLKVKIPARPNHQEGWVRSSDVTLSSHSFHVELKLSEFLLRAWDGDNLIAETNVVIGAAATKTPLGRFYINEKIPQQDPNGFYGPWVLSTNGYSESLDMFGNPPGLPVIAFHGTNQPGLIGTANSNGCVRMPNEVVTQLAQVLPAGTPINIVA